MTQPTNREEFKKWCLRKLGHPVIEINVDQDQVDDRVDEAISYWNDYHFDGTEKTFFKKELDQTDIDNQYITVPENIIGVINIFDIGDSLSTNNLFNIRYQFALNEIYDLSNYNLSNYYMAMQLPGGVTFNGMQILQDAQQEIDKLDTDWFRAAETGDTTTQTSIATQKQALRDIPQQAGFPENVIWPTTPSV